MRKQLIVGNWKMNGSRSTLGELDAIGAAAVRMPQIDVAICLPFTLIDHATARFSSLQIGAQDCHEAPAGAHTGCVSANMLKETGAKAVIVGHSERRRDQHETSVVVREKAAATVRAGMTAIICVGETEAERKAGNAFQAVTAQLAASVPADSAGDIVIAYEPVWAIGTGLTEAPRDVDDMHERIRAILADILGSDRATTTRILYGGSIKPSNASDIFALDNVDGGLIGGASLLASTFIPIMMSIRTRLS